MLSQVTTARRYFGGNVAVSEFIAVSFSSCMFTLFGDQSPENFHFHARVDACARSHCTQRTWPSSSRWTKSVAAGGCAGICYWLVAFPFDGTSHLSELTFRSSHAIWRSCEGALDGCSGWRAPPNVRALQHRSAACFHMLQLIDIMQGTRVLWIVRGNFMRRCVYLSFSMFASDE